ncbi:NAD(P)/FAD-dependent oxidoreductase [Falsirhodobacter halotolerans]|uniref:NAD(P)/FAD-dependent oxidoreductase n=1 Tax=Falsirhodobacter halotolerans TaxID=1146892 RepID=UPI001FD2244F|nr:FAD-dependent oxidoreductase [Falsirhodobacter halotolerans]MCJ8141128.1 FAD-binding oxidoreductase [Falsirhodobacter halotolerans]
MPDFRIAPKTTPFWWEEAPVRPLPDTPMPARADVVIVGAGYAGLTAGLTLARAGRSVVILDKMNPGEGASSRNGGITSGNIRPGFSDLKRRHGEARALAIEAEGKDARAFTYEFIRAEGIDCDLQMTGRFYGAIDRRKYDRMARDAETLSRRLQIDAFGVPEAEQRRYLGTDFYRGGSVRMDIGGLHPAKYHAGLLRVTQAAGAVVRSGVAVMGVARDGAGFTVATSAGPVAARQVLVCTNGYTDGADPWLRRRIVPVRSRIIATDKLAPDLMARLMPRLMMCGEDMILGCYYRPSPDGTRILLGGRDASQSGSAAWPTEMLRRHLIRLFPELADVGLSHSWFGNVAMHRDMLPRIFDHDGVTYATGFCGSGVVWAPWIGRRAALRMLAEDSPRSAFDFRPMKAVPLYAGKPYFMPTLIQIYRLQDRMALKRAER